MKNMTYRYIARVVIEAATPLALGDGEKSLTTDRLVARDINGLPFIPGTSITGVLRHTIEQDLSEVEKKQWKTIFGYQGKGNDGQGSRVVVSSAYFTGKNMQVFEGLSLPDWNDKFYSVYRKLPVRDHVRITHRGVAEKGAKFDEEVVFKGTRFTFEIELAGTQDDKAEWSKLLETICRNDFRLGGGTRKGFGELTIVSIHQKIYNLSDNNDLNSYLDKSSSLASQFDGEVVNITEKQSPFSSYELHLKPDSFFLFGSGKGSEDADMTPVKETVISWNGNNPEVVHNNVLIPGSSVKGAIAHRVAYHSNKVRGVFANGLKNSNSLLAKLATEKYHIALVSEIDFGKQEDIKKVVTEYNPEVVELFGFSVNSGDKKLVSLNDKKRGVVMISDMFETEHKPKILNHVKIDRFTGGAIDGALFNEEVSALGKEKEIVLKVVLASKISEKAEKALEAALKDIASGLLPLGGGTMRGNGCFTGKLLKDGKVEYEHTI